MWKKLGLCGAMLLILGGELVLPDRTVTAESSPAAQNTNSKSASRRRGRGRRVHRRRGRRTHKH